MKTKRQAQILELIAEKDIETQNQMMEELLTRGVKSTQATLSRDIKELRLLKELSPGGGYRYASAARDEKSDRHIRLRKIFRESVMNFAVAQNIVVIHTLPGLANAAGAALDSMELPELIGTIAGDDTAFLAMKDNEAALEFCSELEAMM